MKFSPIVLMLFATLVFLVGCGKKEEDATSEAQSKAEAEKLAATATPTRLALFVAQKIESQFTKANALWAIAFPNKLSTIGFRPARTFS